VSERRKLAAILVSDVVGYSRLAGADEERILARLRALRSDLIVAVHHGRIVKRTGDGSIIEFRSVVDAVRCAIEVQSGMVERNAGLPPERRIEFRVGIHVGDVVEESDGDLMGDGVNIAARLEGIAAPGAICLSEQAYWQVKQRLDLKVSDLGATRLKNIAEPVHVYSLEVGQPTEAKPAPLGIGAVRPEPPAPWASGWSSRWPALAAIAALVLLAVAAGLFAFGGRLTKPTRAAHLSIVVLPFANLSGDPAQDYVADGITENLTTELSRIKGSFVIARNTAFTYKGKSVDAKEIGKQLAVRYVLEGSVQREQNRVRVNAQLIDAESGAHLWADRFEEDIGDLFKLQDQVVTRLTSAVGQQLVVAEAEKAARSKDPDAIDLTMRGRALMQSMSLLATKEQNDDAIALFEQALKLDPNESDALAGLALAYARSKLRRWNPETDNTAKILELSNRAIELDPTNVTAYLAKAFSFGFAQDWNEVIRTANAGLAIDPNSAALFAARGTAEGLVGRYDERVADLETSRKLSPRTRDFFPFWWCGECSATATFHLPDCVRVHDEWVCL
jgi:adenylate cyclase